MKKNTTKLFAMLLLFALVVTALSSCGIVFSAEYRFGLAIIENEKSKIAAAVIIDSSDRIALVRIDEMQNGTSVSKKDLGDDYGMKSASKIGSEWYEHIAYLERELVGKKIDDLVSPDDNGMDLSAGCTVKVDNYLAAVISAIENAKSSEESFKSRVDNLAISLNIFAGKAGEDGSTVVAVSAAALSRGYTMAQDSAFFGATSVNCRLGFGTYATSDGRIATTVLIDDEDRIVLVKIDEFQNGKDKSKKELGKDYGMAAGSEIGKEWFEQIEFLENHLVGKSAPEVAGVVSYSADLSAGCTFYIDGHVAAVLKAIEDARYASVTTTILDELTLSLKLTKTNDGIHVSAEAKEFGRTFAAISGDATAPEALRFALATSNNGKVAAAVVINSADRIVAVKIDEIDVSDGNKISKKDLGYSYGMTGIAPNGEWFEQIAHLESTLIGKTVEEVVSVQYGGADISAGCTVYVGNYNQAVINAVNAANSATAFTASALDARDIRLTLTADDTGAITASAAVHTGIYGAAASDTKTATV